MKNLTKNIIIIIGMLILLILMFTTNTHAVGDEPIKLATGIINPSDYKPEDLQTDDVSIVTEKANTIIDYIGIIGIIVTVVSLIVLGIKYMVGSIEEKADYKKSMIPYLVGVFMFFAVTQILLIIYKFVEQFI